MDNNTADISVNSVNAVKEAGIMDCLLRVRQCPDDAVGFIFEENRVNLYYAPAGKVMCLFVESPTEAGAAMEYTPADAVKALLVEADISHDAAGSLFYDGNTSKVTGLEKALPECTVVDKGTDVCYNYGDLMDTAEDLYNALSWD